MVLRRHCNSLMLPSICQLVCTQAFWACLTVWSGGSWLPSRASCAWRTGGHGTCFPSSRITASRLPLSYEPAPSHPPWHPCTCWGFSPLVLESFTLNLPIAQSSILFMSQNIYFIDSGWPSQMTATKQQNSLPYPTHAHQPAGCYPSTSCPGLACVISPPDCLSILCVSPPVGSMRAGTCVLSVLCCISREWMRVVLKGKKMRVRAGGWEEEQRKESRW